MMRVLFAGGGTGGHVYPALAVAEALAGEMEALFVGSRRGIEAQIVGQAGFAYEGLRIEGFHRRWTLRNLGFPFLLVGALYAAGRLVDRFRPHVVLGTGGFASFPPVFVSQLRGLPTLVQEQNALPGISTRLLARRAQAIHVAYGEAIQGLPHAARSRARLTGNPVRASLIAALMMGADPRIARRQARVQLAGLDPELPTLLVIGGSQGSRLLNRALGAFLRARKTVASGPRFQIVWATGRKLHQEVLDRERVEQFGLPVVIHPYLDDMAKAYAAADLVLCRAGAVTCAELALVGRPALLVPLASAAGGHQEHNALALVRAGAARMLPETRLLTPDSAASALEEALSALLGDAPTLAAMGEAMNALAKPEAAGDIAEELRTLAQRRGEAA